MKVIAQKSAVYWEHVLFIIKIQTYNPYIPCTRGKISSAFSECKVSRMFYLYPAACNIPDSKVHEANMGPIWGRQDPGGPHVGPMNFAIWDVIKCPL